MRLANGRCAVGALVSAGGGGGDDSIQAPGHSSLGGRLCAVMGGLPAGMAFSTRPTDDCNESSGRAWNARRLEM